MMRPVADLPLVHVYKPPVDMRKSINGLAVMVEEVLTLNPFSSHLFVFANRRRDKVKVLYWERNGFCLWYKRLERERFKWPIHLSGDVLSLTGRELNWLLDGLDISRMQAHTTLRYATLL